VSVSSLSRWAARLRQEGQQAALHARGGDPHARAIAAQAALILLTYEREPQLFLHEPRA
jgi:transposase